MVKYVSGKQHERLMPPFFAHYVEQNGPISPQIGQNGLYPPPKKNWSKNRGDEEFVLFIHI